MDVTTIHMQTLQGIRGVPVTIRRKAQSCTLVAVPAMSKAQLVGKDGSFSEITVDDWLILVSEWTLQEPAHPAKGDELTIDGATERYLIAHPDGAQPAYRNFNQTDRPAKAWRVHSVPR